MPFHRATQTWFDENFPAPTEVQARGWEQIAAGKHALLVAPTGSGKTLAAFLAGIDALGQRPPDVSPGVRLLYVSPLKALVYDIERNLRAPLVGITRVAERLELPFAAPRVAVRTGDTPQKERRQQSARDPAEILVTTPESLYLLLGSKAADTLRTVDTVIVDEIHALAPSKRGAHLALSLERLAELADEPQRIGLSATVRPLDAVAGFLGGTRPVEIAVDTSRRPGPGPGRQRAGAGHAEPGRGRGRQATERVDTGGALLARSRHAGNRARYLAGDLPADTRRDSRAPLDHRIRQQPWFVRTPDPEAQ